MRPTPATLGNRNTLARQPAGRRGFTLTELLVVIGIIVMVMAMAVPAFNVLTGRRSQEMAQNQLSAALSQARILAISNQKKTGVLIFRDQEQRVSLAVVESIGAGSTANSQQMDMVAGQRILALQKGVEIQLMGKTGDYSGSEGSGVLTMNGPLGEERILGLILFDAKGRIDTQTRWQPASNGGGRTSRLAPVLGRLDNDDYYLPVLTPTDPAIAAVLYTGNVRDGQGYVSDALLEENGTLLLINRYNGTLRAPAGGSNAQED